MAINLSGQSYGQSDITGDLIPDIYINRIILEGGGDVIVKNDPHIKEVYHEVIGNPEAANNLTIKLNLNLKDKLRDNAISQWFLNLDFDQYIKVLVFVSTKENVTGRFSTRNRQRFINNPNFQDELQNLIRENGLPDYQILDIPAVQQGWRPMINLYQDTSGNQIYDIDLRAEFTVSELRPRHLSIIAFTFIDIERLANEYDLSLNDRDTFAEGIGTFKIYNVIENGRARDSAVVFYDPNNNIWQGPVHFNSTMGWMAGAEHIDDAHAILTRRVVPNTLLQDFRNVEETQQYRINLAGSAGAWLFPSLGKIFKNFVAYNLDVNANKAYNSDISISRAKSGKCEFFFSLDFIKLCKDRTTFPKILDNNPDLARDFKIKSLKVLRRRIIRTKNKDSIGIIPFGKPDRAAPNNTFSVPSEEVVAWFTDEDLYNNDFRTLWINNGDIREVEILAGNSVGVRHFTGRDASIVNRTFGEYQYGFEIFIEDPIKKYLQSQLNSLVEQRNVLKSYYVEASRPMSTTRNLGNYNVATNRFRLGFADTVNIESLETVITELLKNLLILGFKMLENDTMALVWAYTVNAIISPTTGTPRGIEYILKFMNDIISNLQIALGIVDSARADASVGATPPLNENPSGTGGKNNNVFSYKTFFSNDFFDAEIDKNTGVDYLGEVQERHMSHGGGLRQISTNEFFSRTQNEILKYFNDQNSDITNLRNAEYIFNTDITLEDGRYSSLSPRRVYLKNVSPLQLRTQHIISEQMPSSIMIVRASQILKYKKSADGGKKIPSFRARVPNPRSRLTAAQMEIRDNLTEVMAAANLTFGVSDEISAAEALRAKIEIATRYERQQEIARQQRSANSNNGNNADDGDTGRAVPANNSIANPEDTEEYREYLQVSREINENLVDVHTSRDGDVLLANNILFNLLFNFIIDEDYLSSEDFLRKERQNKKQSIQYFNLNELDSGLWDIRQEIQQRPEHEQGAHVPIYRAFRDLPNQIKALFVSSIRPAVVKKNLHPHFERVRGVTRWIDKDPFKDALSSIFLFMNYFCLSSIKVMKDFSTKTFQADSVHPLSLGAIPTDLAQTETITERHIKNPRFVSLTREILDQAASSEKSLLCRMDPYENTILGIKTPKGLKLNVLNRYFIIYPNSIMPG